MRLTHNGPEFDWKHKTELFKAEINFLFDQAQLQGSINIYLDEHIHHKHFPDLLLEVLRRNAEYKTHFQIQSNSGVIILSCQKRDPNGKDLHPQLLPSKSGPPRELSPNEAQILRQAFPQTQGWTWEEFKQKFQTLGSTFHHQELQNELPFNDQLNERPDHNS